MFWINVKVGYVTFTRELAYVPTLTKCMYLLDHLLLAHLGLINQVHMCHLPHSLMIRWPKSEFPVLGISLHEYDWQGQKIYVLELIHLGTGWITFIPTGLLTGTQRGVSLR